MMTWTNSLAVDIGGTFTDVVLETPSGRQSVKLLTTPQAPERAVLEGVATILRRGGLSLAEIGLFVHGTTLATNSLIERKGARTALITTAGFRDVLEMRSEGRVEQYDLGIENPPPLVPRSWRLPVAERMSAQGTPIMPLDSRGLQALVPTLQREKIESVAVGFLHSYANPAHERAAASLLREWLPGLHVTLSAEVSPEMREYERFSTAAANAYVQPIMARYLQRLSDQLTAGGLTAPLLLMLSSGSLTTVQTAMRFPVRLMESGPAGGAIFAASLARHAGLDRVVSLDMGGTTAKICFVDDGQPQSSRVFEVGRVYRFKKGSGLPLRIPVVEMVEIGAGGGSIARRDKLGKLAVGPQSAGADPGPACYGRGGTGATVTDANLLLGRIDTTRFAGGLLKLDDAASRAALATLGAEFGTDAGGCAAGLVEVVDENMTNAARVHGVEGGKAMIGRTLIAFGGGGPLHVGRIAQKLGVDSFVVPSGAGVGSAIGFLRAPIAFEIVRSNYQRLGSLDLPAVQAMLVEMGQEAAGVIAVVDPGAAIRENRKAYMRYVGQGHELAVDLDGVALNESFGAEVQARFAVCYLDHYARQIEQGEIEILSWSVLATLNRPAAEVEAAAVVPHDVQSQGAAEVYDAEARQQRRFALYERARLRPGGRLRGPALVVEDETTTVVPGDYDAIIDARGSIVCTRRDGAQA
jgi:N-methylhydantoinase A